MAHIESKKQNYPPFSLIIPHLAPTCGTIYNKKTCLAPTVLTKFVRNVSEGLFIFQRGEILAYRLCLVYTIIGLVFIQYQHCAPSPEFLEGGGPPPGTGPSDGH